MSIVLRDYQKRILNNLYKSLKVNNKVLLSLPTGAGKTIMMYKWAEQMANKGLKTVIVVDRVELVEQTYKINPDVSVLKSGSKYKFDKDKLIQIVMLQTGFRREEQLLELKPDFIFFDEIHQYIEGSMFTALCDFMITAKIIGVTATPIDEKGYLLPGFSDYIGDLQTCDLINAGYLVKPNYYVPSDYNLDLSTVRISNGDYNIDELDNIMIDSEKLDKIYKEWFKLGKMRKTIAFCSSIKQAEATCDYFYKKGINCRVIHSKLSYDQRETYLYNFKIGIVQIIFNVGILVAGFDEPTVDCVMFLNPTKILRRYLQQAGRGLRIAKNKKECLMLDFADIVRQHGFCDDLRFYREKQKIKDECTIKECPECGAIVSKSVKKCPYCEYDFSIIEENSDCNVRKKDLERLQKAMSMQLELKEKISNLVDSRGYKQGYKWFLFIDCLKTKKPSESNIQFFRRKLSKISKIEKKNYKLAALKFD